MSVKRFWIITYSIYWDIYWIRATTAELGWLLLALGVRDSIAQASRPGPGGGECGETSRAMPSTNTFHRHSSHSARRASQASTVALYTLPQSNLEEKCYLQPRGELPTLTSHRSAAQAAFSTLIQTLIEINYPVKVLSDSSIIHFFNV